MSAVPDLADKLPWEGPRRTRHYRFQPEVTRDIFAPLRVMLDSAAAPAACKADPDPDRWFESGKASSKDLAAMQRLCDHCPLRQACLEYAMENAVAGFWAGTTYADRERVRQRRNVKAIPLPTASNYVRRTPVDADERPSWSVERDSWA